MTPPRLRIPVDVSSAIVRMTVLGFDTKSRQNREVRPQLARVLIAEAKMQYKNGLTCLKTPAPVPLLP